MNIREKKPGRALGYICSACSANCLIDVDLYKINILSEDAALGVDK